MCAGTREDGSRIEANDPDWASLTRVAEAARDRPQAWLEQTAIYGSLSGQDRFAKAFAQWLTMIWRDGTAAALAAYATRP
jgi:mannitol 2-dehydrogenase